MTRSQDDIRSRLFEVVTPVVEHAGYELVDLRYVREQSGWVLRVFIDRLEADAEANHGGIGFADCEDISRELSAVLDVEDPIPQAYSLEVSSPGLDRPLRLGRHFQRFRGETAKIALGAGVDGRRNFTGVIEGFDDDRDVIKIRVDGTPFDLPLCDLRSAKLVPDWDAVLKGGAAQDSTLKGTSGA